MSSVEFAKNEIAIYIRDVTGRNLITGKLSHTLVEEIDVSKFSDGVYLVELTDGTNDIFKRLIKN